MSTNCTDCPFKGRKVPSKGDPDTCKYVLMGEAPGNHEITKGQPFVGPTGRLLEAFYKQIGKDLRSDEFYLMNAMSCRVKRKPDESRAVAACRPRVLEELESINTGATIVLMGNMARESLYPSEAGGILGSRGWRKWKGRNVFVMAHPSYYLYNPDQAPMLLKDVGRVARGRLPQIGPFEFAPTEGDYAIYMLDTHEKLDEFIASLHRVPIEERGFLAYDLETDQIDYQRDRILCMSISKDEGTAYIIPDTLLYEDGIEFLTTNWPSKQWERFMEDPRYRTASYLRPNAHTVAQLKHLFSLPKYRWVGHNSKFDLRFLIGQLGVTNAHGDFDTIMAHYTLDERSGGHGLKSLADDYFDVGDYEVGLFQYISKKSAHYSRIPRSVLYKYNAMDTECTLRLAKALERELIEQDLYEWPFMNVIMFAFPMLLEAELQGVWIDWDEVDRIEVEELLPELERLAIQLREISGKPELNPLSSVGVNDILYDDLRFPVVKARTRAGGHKVTGRSSQRAIMDAWFKMQERGTLKVSPQGVQFLEALRSYRHLRKLLGSYIRKWQDVRGTDDCVHTSYLIRGTVTGRLAAKDPPMQTIPSKVTDKWGPMVANIHRSRPGWSFLYADYSQAELMVAAGLSGDKFMISTFQNEEADYHEEVARAAFGENFTKDNRQACKRLTFGWLYGGNVKEIALDALQFDGPVAERFANEWDDLFKTIVAWRKTQGDLMLKQGFVASIYGRRRRQLLLVRDNIGKAKRIAINAPIQSAVSDFNLLAAARLYYHYRSTDYAKVVLLIHDSLIMEVRNDMIEEVKPVMRRIMLEVPTEKFPEIPFKADVKVGTMLGDF